MSSLRFAVFMDQPQAEDVLIRYETADLEARADSDYLAASGEAGIVGAITGRAIYEGTLDLAEAQALADGEKG